MKHLFLCLVLFSARIALAQLPACKVDGNKPHEVAFDAKTQRVVFFDQSTAYDRENKFQVWDLKQQKRVTVGKLPDPYNLILGFADSKTIVFAKFRDADGFNLTFGPIGYYNLDTKKIREVSVAEGDSRLISYNLKAGIAVVEVSGRSGPYQMIVDLKTGKSTFPNVVLDQANDGFSPDGSNLYFLIWFHENREIAIFNSPGPQFFNSGRGKVVSVLTPEEIGISRESKSKISSSSKAVSDSGGTIAVSLEVNSDQPSVEKEFRKIMWLDLPTGQKTFCDVDYNRGFAKTQIVDEKKRIVLFQEDLYPGIHKRTLVNMKTCVSTALPKMDGLTDEIKGHFFSMKNERLYYSRGSVWNLDNGTPLLRTCE